MLAWKGRVGCRSTLQTDIAACATIRRAWWCTSGSRKDASGRFWRWADLPRMLNALHRPAYAPVSLTEKSCTHYHLHISNSTFSTAAMPSGHTCVRLTLRHFDFGACSHATTHTVWRRCVCLWSPAYNTSSLGPPFPSSLFLHPKLTSPFLLGVATHTTCVSSVRRDFGRINQTIRWDVVHECLHMCECA